MANSSASKKSAAASARAAPTKKPVASAGGAHSLRTILVLAALAVVLATIIAVPLIRYKEARTIQTQVEAASAAIVVALQNDSIFTGLPEESAARLNDSAMQLSHIHDALVLMDIHVARGSWRAALNYTEYIARLGNKLRQIAVAEKTAAERVADYNEAVAGLKGSTIKNRADAQNDVNAKTAAARSATELAYQECVILDTLTREYGFAQSQALSELPTIGADVQAAVGSIRPVLGQAIHSAHDARKIFNPAARLPG